MLRCAEKLCDLLINPKNRSSSESASQFGWKPDQDEPGNRETPITFWKMDDGQDLVRIMLLPLPLHLMFTLNAML